MAKNNKEEDAERDDDAGRALERGEREEEEGQEGRRRSSARAEARRRHAARESDRGRVLMMYGKTVQETTQRDGQVGAGGGGV